MPIENVQVLVCVLRDLCVRTAFYDSIKDDMDRNVKALHKGVLRKCLNRTREKLSFTVLRGKGAEKPQNRGGSA